MSNCLEADKVKRIDEMAQAGVSIRDIADQLGVSKVTVGKYVATTARPDTVSRATKLKHVRKRKIHFLVCAYCNKQFLDKSGEKTSDLKHGRITRAFCTHRCAMNLRARERHNDKCKRCERTRKDLAAWRTEGSAYQATGVCFTKGYCPHCYSLLRQYAANELLVKTHELTQQLRKESNNELNRKEHRRPSQIAS